MGVSQDIQKSDWAEPPSPALWGIMRDLLTSIGLTDLHFNLSGSPLTKSNSASIKDFLI